MDIFTVEQLNYNQTIVAQSQYMDGPLQQYTMSLHEILLFICFIHSLLAH